ncbi:uncharacterized protein LOC132791672 [Drosophila nasuta]|uniref:uncharacterized protein LOC132791672 n=1 Tax=Drosophila nasuta TaxID=42062 RepID=UPI00295F0554|nr:uncharacterized protein LOC132791672 [Drosophila nasuta]
MPKWLLCTVCCLLLIVSSLAIDELEPNVDGTEETNNKLPSVVQRAVCTVNAGEVKASAEAVTTKTLKGVCGSDEMNLAFRNLEEKLYGELREIKELLKKLADVQEEQDSNAIPIVPVPSIIKPFTLQRFKFEQITVKPNQEVASKKLQPLLKQLESAPEREEEVDKFNNTMLADEDFKLFTYYWKLENITEHFANASTESMKSPIFSIRGRTVQLQCTFQHLHRDMINLQLTQAYPSKSKENNIILDMGGQLKHLKWAEHETLKHKISLLDQSQTHRRTQDLSSQELTKLDMGFSIPNSALLGSNYVRHNSLLIQVILYL